MKLSYRIINWISEKLFPPPDVIKCLRCGENLKISLRVHSVCPRCKLEHGFTGSWEPVIMIGDRYTAFDIRDAELIAKEHGIQLPPWPRS